MRLAHHVVGRWRDGWSRWAAKHESDVSALEEIRHVRKPIAKWPDGGLTCAQIVGVEEVKERVEDQQRRPTVPGRLYVRPYDVVA
jgi:hypothetical protein